MQQARSRLRVWVVLFCLLSVTSSFNLTVLVDVLDRNLLLAHGRVSVAEVVEDIDEDADLYHSSTQGVDGRRGERKQAPGNPHFVWESTFSHPPATPGLPAAIACRAGSEHALRTGIGAPLLC